MDFWKQCGTWPPDKTLLQTSNRFSESKFETYLQNSYVTLSNPGALFHLDLSKTNFNFRNENSLSSYQSVINGFANAILSLLSVWINTWNDASNMIQNYYVNVHKISQCKKRSEKKSFIIVWRQIDAEYTSPTSLAKIIRCFNKIKTL